MLTVRGCVSCGDDCAAQAMWREAHGKRDFGEDLAMEKAKEKPDCAFAEATVELFFNIT